MTKIIFLSIVFLTFSGYSQTLTIAQIDSIAKNHRSGIAEGNISSEKVISSKIGKRTVNGSGGFSYSTYLYDPNEENYNKLSKEEKRKYDFDKYSKLVKGVYHSGIYYENDSSENIYGDFYYNDRGLFFVKIRETNQIGEKEYDKTQSFDMATDSHFWGKVSFTNDIKTWIDEKNAEILKYAGKSFPEKK